MQLLTVQRLALYFAKNQQRDRTFGAGSRSGYMYDTESKRVHTHALLLSASGSKLWSLVAKNILFFELTTVICLRYKLSTRNQPSWALLFWNCFEVSFLNSFERR